MPVFKLMRSVNETPDIISKAISDATIGEGGRPSLFFMNFWNMKQRGELHASETPAVWAVMMRAVDPSTVVRLVVDHALSGRELHRQVGQIGASWSAPYQIAGLVSFMDETLKKTNGQLAVQDVSKVRLNLVLKLRACERIRGSTWTTFCSSDADLLLRACQTAIEVKREDDKRWEQERYLERQQSTRSSSRG